MGRVFHARGRGARHGCCRLTRLELAAQPYRARQGVATAGRPWRCVGGAQTGTASQGRMQQPHPDAPTAAGTLRQLANTLPSAPTQGCTVQYRQAGSGAGHPRLVARLLPLPGLLGSCSWLWVRMVCWRQRSNTCVPLALHPGAAAVQTAGPRCVMAVRMAWHVG